jgi:hypothetical protein
MVEEVLHHASVPGIDGFTTYVERGVTDPFGLRDLPAVSGLPDVIDQVVGARRVRMYDQIIFGIILVIPRVKDLGAVISATSYQVEIWNADDVAHLGQSVAIAGSSGVTLSGGPTLPASWPPFSSYFVTVNVDGQGDAIIDTLITWLFPGFTGTDHHVLGFRLTILATDPDWDAEPFTEAYGYATNVMQSRNMTEQRIVLESKGRREISYIAFAPDPAAAGELITRLFNGGRFLFGVPYWPDATPLGASLIGGESTIVVDTTGRIFQAGGLVALRRSARVYQTLTVLSLTSSTITFTGPVAGAWPAADTLVVPVLSARLTDAAELEHQKPGIAQVRASFLTQP